MAASPRWKVYSAEGEYVSACRYVEDAAAVVALYGCVATIRDGHREVVWTEGDDKDGCAADSYDHVADVVRTRVPGAFAVTR